MSSWSHSRLWGSVCYILCHTTEAKVELGKGKIEWLLMLLKFGVGKKTCVNIMDSQKNKQMNSQRNQINSKFKHKLSGSLHILSYFGHLMRRSIWRSIRSLWRRL